MATEVISEKDYRNVSLEQLTLLAKEIYEAGMDYSIWLFNAPMGAGKTTFIRFLCNFLAVEDKVSSPTFGIVNEYRSRKIGEIFHFDFYRIKNEMEAFDLGAEDYFYSNSLCLIEWAERIPSLIPDSFLEINIDISDNGIDRDFTVRKYG